MEYRPRHFGGPLLFRGAVPGHFLDRLPIDVVTQIGLTGIANAGAGLHHYFNHFLQWEGPVVEGAAGGWLLSGVIGAATIAQDATRGGQIVLTSDGTANCDPTLQLGITTAHMPFRYTVGRRLWLAAKMEFSALTSTEFFFGFGTADTEPTVTNTFPADGIFWEKAAAPAVFDFHVRKDGVSTERAAIGSTITNTVTLGIYVNGVGAITPYQDMEPVAAGYIAAGTANIPSASTDNMTFMLAFRGASLSVSLEWLLLAQEM